MSKIKLPIECELFDENIKKNIEYRRQKFYNSYSIQQITFLVIDNLWIKKDYYQGGEKVLNNKVIEGVASCKDILIANLSIPETLQYQYSVSFLLDEFEYDYSSFEQYYDYEFEKPESSLTSTKDYKIPYEKIRNLRKKLGIVEIDWEHSEYVANINIYVPKKFLDNLFHELENKKFNEMTIGLSCFNAYRPITNDKKISPIGKLLSFKLNNDNDEHVSTVEELLITNIQSISDAKGIASEPNVFLKRGTRAKEHQVTDSLRLYEEKALYVQLKNRADFMFVKIGIVIIALLLLTLLFILILYIL
jgi:hypothetical protein